MSLLLNFPKAQVVSMRCECSKFNTNISLMKTTTVLLDKSADLHVWLK